MEFPPEATVKPPGQVRKRSFSHGDKKFKILPAAERKCVRIFARALGDVPGGRRNGNALNLCRASRGATHPCEVARKPI